MRLCSIYSYELIFKYNPDLFYLKITHHFTNFQTKMSYLIEHGFELIKQGAEGKLYAGTYLGRPTVVKERFPKSYRHPILDSSITKERTKSEAKAILKCLLCSIRAPTIYLVDYDKGRIYMERVQNSITVKEYIVNLNDKIDADIDKESCFSLLDKLTDKIGKVLADLHRNNIIHGDLTTSNMLLAPMDGLDVGCDFNHDDGEIVMLDFGLSHIDGSAEGKGVDLYVLERALTSTHSALTRLFENVLLMYKSVNKGQSKEVLNKLEDIRLRGRKRTMVG